MKITQRDVAGIVNTAYTSIYRLVFVQSAFVCTGLWPINPGVFTELDFIPSEHFREAEHTDYESRPLTSGTANLLEQGPESALTPTNLIETQPGPSSAHLSKSPFNPSLPVSSVTSDFKKILVNISSANSFSEIKQRRERLKQNYGEMKKLRRGQGILKKKKKKKPGDKKAEKHVKKLDFGEVPSERKSTDVTTECIIYRQSFEEDWVQCIKRQCWAHRFFQRIAAGKERESQFRCIESVLYRLSRYMHVTVTSPPVGHLDHVLWLQHAPANLCAHNEDNNFLRFYVVCTYWGCMSCARTGDVCRVTCGLSSYKLLVKLRTDIALPTLAGKKFEFVKVSRLHRSVFDNVPSSTCSNVNQRACQVAGRIPSHWMGCAFQETESNPDALANTALRRQLNKHSSHCSVVACALWPWHRVLHGRARCLARAEEMVRDLSPASLALAALYISLYTADCALFQLPHFVPISHVTSNRTTLFGLELVERAMWGHGGTVVRLHPHGLQHVGNITVVAGGEFCRSTAFLSPPPPILPSLHDHFFPPSLALCNSLLRVHKIILSELNWREVLSRGTSCTRGAQRPTCSGDAPTRPSGTPLLLKALHDRISRVLIYRERHILVHFDRAPICIVEPVRAILTSRDKCFMVSLRKTLNWHTAVHFCDSNLRAVILTIDFLSTAASVAAERLACSPPTKTNLVQSPAGLFPDCRMWESCRTMPLVGEFPRGSPVSPRPFIPALIHTHTQGRKINAIITDDDFLRFCRLLVTTDNSSQVRNRTSFLMGEFGIGKFPTARCAVFQRHAAKLTKNCGILPAACDASQSLLNVTSFDPLAIESASRQKHSYMPVATRRSLLSTCVELGDTRTTLRQALSSTYKSPQKANVSPLERIHNTYAYAFSAGTVGGERNCWHARSCVYCSEDMKEMDSLRCSPERRGAASSCTTTATTATVCGAATVNATATTAGLATTVAPARCPLHLYLYVGVSAGSSLTEAAADSWDATSSTLPPPGGGATNQQTAARSATPYLRAQHPEENMPFAAIDADMPALRGRVADLQSEGRGFEPRYRRRGRFSVRLSHREFVSKSVSFEPRRMSQQRYMKHDEKKKKLLDLSPNRTRFDARSGHQRFVCAVPDDATGRWVFSGISRYHRPFIPPLLHHTHLNHPPSALEILLLGATPLCHSRRGRSGINACGYRTGQCRWSAYFPVPFSPFHPDAAPYSPLFTLIDYQDDVNSRANLFTHSNIWDSSIKGEPGTRTTCPIAFMPKTQTVCGNLDGI
ncbi:hypothetical protein PR048_014942 [Dryococelus australis]|uniref:Uncharacterized protein n=1 Tax=Dryococelus australis TaxID=614101 RepID=A0ABQ9HGF2_9NEOP|nr:hypothetical protein PR048_014942 [Dryococelus australis]